MAGAANVLPIHPDEVDGLLPQVRQADLDEIEGALGVSMREALMDGVTGSCKVAKIVVGDKVLAVFGDADCPGLPGVGVPWLISTVHVERHAKAFLQVCRPEVANMMTRHHGLLNFVDVRNTVAIRWLKWLGFTFEAAIPYGLADEPFYPFHMGRS